MFVDAENKTITCKIAYYGPGLSGKTSNFQYLHDHAPIRAGQIISTDINAERTLHFQFMRNDLQDFKGYRLIFDFHTIPGQSYYLSTRLQLLSGADGIVFVVDSTREAMDENIDSMNDLFENLRKQNIADDIPLCVQFNKQDLDSAIPIEQLNPLLNSYMKQSFSASAVTGAGVVETMVFITDEVLAYIEHQGFGSSSAYPVPQLPQATQNQGSSTLTPIQPSLLNKSPVTSAITKNEYWLLTCCSCDSILEVPKAKPGDLFACGNCQQTLQVVNPETGITKPYVPPAVATQQAAAQSKKPQVGLEESSYSMQALPPKSQTPPAQPNRMPAAPAPSENSDYNMSALPEVGGPGALAQDPSGRNQVQLPEVLAGYYTIHALDQSLLGQRYVLQDQGTGVRVRAMVFSAEATRQPGFQGLLETQVRQASQINHQNVAGFIGLQWNGQIPLLLTQYTDDCESLKDILDRRKKLSPPQAIDITHKLSLALCEVKRRNISHGWIRPECIQIGPNGTVILDDVASPKLHAYLIREGRGRTASTEYYLAPEHQAGAVQSDERSDMFLLGLLLFRMLTGEGMITGFSAHEALHKLKSVGPRSVRSANSELSRELDSLCSQLCALERKDRFQNMTELVDLLARFGGGAKRHTLRQTRTQTRSTINPTPTRGPGVNQTNTIRKTTTMHSRSTTGGNSYHEVDHPKLKPKRSSNLFTIILLILLLAAGAAAYHFYQLQEAQLATMREEQYQVPKATPPKNDSKVEPTRKAPEIRKSLEGRIEDALDQYEKEPGNTTLETQIVTDINQVNVGKRKVQLLERLKTIREAHVDLAAQQTSTTKPDSKPATGNANSSIAATPNTTPAANTTAVEPPNAAKLIQDIDFHLQLGQFGEAHKKALTIPIDAVKETQIQRINEEHQIAKNKLQLAIVALKDLADVSKQLNPPRNDWGMDGDRAWADSLYLAAKQRIEAQSTPAVIPEHTTATTPVTEAPAEKTLEAPTTINGIQFQALIIDTQVDALLTKADYAAAQQLAKQLPNSIKEMQAISFKIELQMQSIEVMSKAFKDNNIKFRVNAPFNNKERWDVTDILQSGLQLRSPQGSSTNAGWDRIDAGELEKLYSAIANRENGVGKELAIACIAHLRLDQLGPATIARNNARKIAYDQDKTLELLISMRRSHKAGLAAQSAIAAHTAKDNTALNAAYRALKEEQNLGTDTEAFIQKLSAFITIPQQSTSHPNSLKNLLDFSDSNDLQVFSTQTGGWQVVGEALLSSTENASLKRDDLKGTTKLSFRVTFANAQGSMIVNFLGGELRLQLAEQTFQLAAADKATPVLAYPFVPQLPYTINLWVDINKQLHVEINQAATQVIPVAVLTESMKITVNNNTNVTIDDIQYVREQTFVLPEIDKAKQDMIKTALGWDPYGGAELHAPIIKIPPWPGSRSGISRLLTPQDIGVEFEMKGSGNLFVMIGDRDTDNTTGLKIPLPLDEQLVVKVTVTWTKNSLRIETLEPLQAAPNVNTYDNIQVPLKHICIESTKMLNILKPPVMKR